MAGIVDEHRLVGEVNRDRVLEIDVAFACTVERPSLPGAIAVIWLRDRQQYLGIFVRILQAHAAMAVGADDALLR